MSYRINYVSTLPEKYREVIDSYEKDMGVITPVEDDGKIVNDVPDSLQQFKLNSYLLVADMVNYLNSSYKRQFAPILMDDFRRTRRFKDIFISNDIYINQPEVFKGYLGFKGTFNDLKYFVKQAGFDIEVKELVQGGRIDSKCEYRYDKYEQPRATWKFNNDYRDIQFKQIYHSTRGDECRVIDGERVSVRVSHCNLYSQPNAAFDFNNVDPEFKFCNGVEDQDMSKGCRIGITIIDAVYEISLKLDKIYDAALRMMLNRLWLCTILDGITFRMSFQDRVDTELSGEEADGFRLIDDKPTLIYHFDITDDVEKYTNLHKYELPATFKFENLTNDVKFEIDLTDRRFYDGVEIKPILQAVDEVETISSSPYKYESPATWEFDNVNPIQYVTSSADRQFYDDPYMDINVVLFDALEVENGTRDLYDRFNLHTPMYFSDMVETVASSTLKYTSPSVFTFDNSNPIQFEVNSVERGFYDTNIGGVYQQWFSSELELENGTRDMFDKASRTATISCLVFSQPDPAPSAVSSVFKYNGGDIFDNTCSNP